MWVGVSGDTAQFAVAASGHGGRTSAKGAPPRKTLTVTADCGGSNSYRTAVEDELQKLADQTGLRVRVPHYPPGTASGTRSSTAAPAIPRSTGAPSPSSAAKP